LPLDPNLAVLVPIERLHAHPENPRRIDQGKLQALQHALASDPTMLWQRPLGARYDGTVYMGNMRLQAAAALGWTELPVVYEDLDPIEEMQRMVRDNREYGEDDDDKLATLLATLDAADADLSLTGLDEQRVADLLASVAGEGQGGAAGDPADAFLSLSDRFGIVPFSVLDARQGPWLQRKRAWLGIGLVSEIGRGNDNDKTAKGLTYSVSSQPISAYKEKEAYQAKLGREVSWPEFLTAHPGAAKQSGTSIFDPVVCELAYRWFSAPGAIVLDPFAGGSVRGVVAALLGRQYVGIDLSERQVQANRDQWDAILARLPQDATPASAVPALAAPPPVGVAPDALTPVEEHRLPNGGAVWLKRDDTCTIAGVTGGKVRSCWALAQGATGLTTAGSKESLQVNIVAHIAKELGIPCRVHVPSGTLTPELRSAQAAGAEIVQHVPGHNVVISARAREDAAARGWREIPFGMEHEVAVEQTSSQIVNLPGNATRLVVPVGFGMSLAGILHGLRRAGNTLPVLGVCVGASPTKRLAKYAPTGWAKQATLVTSKLDYHAHAPVTTLDGVALDPIYEAKCLPYLQAGDVLWCVGIRETATATAVDGMASHPDPVWLAGDSASELPLRTDLDADLLFSCPPYADLERYSDDAADLSTMPYDDFLVVYRDIITKAAARLKDDRFAVWVVGDIRSKRTGNYRNFVSDTIAAFADAGMALYNEAILVTAIGSLAVRVGKQFTVARKLGKTHQQILVFLKGDARAATAAAGAVEGQYALPDPSAADMAEQADDTAPLDEAA
jgi:1-aminocyclopropane-1-carboxylate deaminase/D-cysteine desulfhydrase-like pyridoxal-dependent ACC family enzyme